ncbi:MAG: zinc-ribbon domain-containing protein [Rhodospirillaceae bacterium]|nr:zinc-ribbon domain-containing protein [Rhodospirillaceae bacterium]
MILTCPQCSTRYLADPVALGPTGRQVRCAKCGHTWHALPPDEPGPRLDVLSPGLDQTISPPTPGAGLPARIEPRPPRRPVGGAMLTGVLALVVLGVLYLGRERIVAAWPDAAQLYGVIGLRVEVPGAGLAFREVTLTRQPVNGRDTVVVEGHILNDTDLPRPVPPILATVRDGSDRALKAWTVRVEPGELQPGQSAAFRTSMIDPPDGATRVALTFARPAGS